MRLLRGVVGYEGRLLTRSLRFRSGVGLYLAIAASVPLGLYQYRDRVGLELGAASYVAESLSVVPFLTLLLSVVVTGGTCLRAGEAFLLTPAPMSNGGWVLRKWVAVVSIVLPVSLLATLFGLAVGVWAAPGLPPWQAALGSWAFEVAPLALLGTAGWLGLVMILRGERAAFFAAWLVLPACLTALNHLLFIFRIRLTADEWSAFRPFQWWVYRTLGALRGQFNSDWFPFPLLASEGAYDIGAAAQSSLQRFALPVALSWLLLAAASGHVGRSRPDTPPSRLGARHALRNFGLFWARFRARFQADGARSRRDLAVVALCCFASAAVFGWRVDRFRRYQRLAAERYRVEVEAIPETTSRTVVPRRWRIQGSVGSGGDIAVSVEGVLANQGEDPVQHFSFELNRALSLEELELTGRRIVKRQRSGDRLVVETDPPLVAGESAQLRAQLWGCPVRDEVALRGVTGSFADLWEGFLAARFVSALSDLSLSESRPAVAPRSLHLAARDLTPVPRYDSWQLTPPAASLGETGREVPEETTLPQFDLELLIDLPKGLVVVDGCGTPNVADGQKTRLRSQCRTHFKALSVTGGRLQRMESNDGRVVLAVLPQHQTRVAPLLRSLERVRLLSGRAWPGIAALDHLVALELPPEFSPDLRQGMERRLAQPYNLGRAVLVPEARLADPTPLAVEEVAAGLLAEEVHARRPLRADERRVVSRIVRIVMLRRMGLLEQTAVLSDIEPWLRYQLQWPILSDSLETPISRRRLPAVLRDLEGRVGWTTLEAGVARFLDVPGEEAVGVRELLAEIEALSGESLDHFFGDFFDGPGLPMLRFEGVTSRRERDGFVVSGQLVNEGRGEVVCPVVVRAEGEEIRAQVRVGTNEVTGFEVALRHRPQTVILDPLETCLRFVTSSRAGRERVDLSRGV